MSWRIWSENLPAVSVVPIAVSFLPFRGNVVPATGNRPLMGRVLNDRRPEWTRSRKHVADGRVSVS